MEYMSDEEEFYKNRVPFSSSFANETYQSLKNSTNVTSNLTPFIRTMLNAHSNQPKTWLRLWGRWLEMQKTPVNDIPLEWDSGKGHKPHAPAPSAIRRLSRVQPNGHYRRTVS